MLRDFMKSRVSDVWKISGAVADRAIGLVGVPLGAVVGVAPSGVQQALLVAGTGAAAALRSSMKFGEDLQRRAVDIAFDTAAFKPVTDAAAESGSPLCVASGKGQPQPELEYLKAVNDAGPTQNSLIVIVLAVTFSGVKRPAEGVAKFEEYLEKFKDQSTPGQKAIYLACLALLRAAAAQAAPAWELPSTVSGIDKLKAELAKAIELTATEPDFEDTLVAPTMYKLFPRWVAGILYANLPWPFGDKKVAMDHLTWCESTIMATPERYVKANQFLHETYYSLAVLNRDAGDIAKATAYLAKSGFGWDRPPIQIATPFCVSSDGLRDAPKHIREAVPGKVFSAYGFEISDMHYIIGEDGSELIAVDAASRVDRCEEAYGAFGAFYRARYPHRKVPPLKTVLMTHYHWDHAGGLDFYRKLNPDLEVYASARFVDEAQRATHQPPPYQWFMGTKFDVATLEHYHPSKTVHTETTITVAGTEIRLLPLPDGGGETPDGMYAYFPGHGVLFTGDVMVPWVGSPFAQEGNPEALLRTLDFTAEIRPVPSTVIHGHGALNTFYPTFDAMLRMRPLLGWLFDETRRRIYAGQNRARILADPLVPPMLLDPAQSDLQFPYLGMREPFVSRVYVTTVGYWGANLEGVDHLSDEQVGPVVARHMDLTEDDFASSIQRMAAAGDIDVAAKVVAWGLARYPESRRLKDAKLLVFQLLVQKYQMLNPFKLCMYANQIEMPVPQLAAVNPH